MMMSELVGGRFGRVCPSDALRVGGFIFTPAQYFPPAHELILTALLLPVFRSILCIDESILRFRLSGTLSSQF